MSFLLDTSHLCPPSLLLPSSSLPPPWRQCSVAGEEESTTMIHTTILLMSVTIFVLTVLFLFVKDYLPDCSPETASKFERRRTDSSAPMI